MRNKTKAIIAGAITLAALGTALVDNNFVKVCSQLGCRTVTVSQYREMKRGLLIKMKDGEVDYGDYLMIVNIMDMETKKDKGLRLNDVTDGTLIDKIVEAIQ